MGIKKLIRKGKQDKAAANAASKIKTPTIPIKEANRINKIRYGSKADALGAAKNKDRD